MGRQVVIVGGGAVATRRAKTFAEAGARVVVIAPTVTAELAATSVSVHHRPYRAGDLAQAWLAVTATDDSAVNAAVAEEAAQARIFCVRADTASSGTARVPAIHSSGDLTISVNAGDDPRRAVELRNLIASSLEIGALSARPVRPAASGSVALVGGGPGDPELITVRGRRLLFEADVVVTDRLAPRSLLSELDPGVEIIDCGKSAHRHNLTQDEINAVIVDRAQHGKRVVRLKGGDPFIFGRGGEELDCLRDAGLDVEVVPGVTAACAAAARLGIPLTHRDVSRSLHLVTGHGSDNEIPALDWGALAATRGTLALYMSTRTLDGVAARLIAGGMSPATPAVAVENVSLPGERVRLATLATLPGVLAGDPGEGPTLVIVGEVVARVRVGALRAA